MNMVTVRVRVDHEEIRRVAVGRLVVGKLGLAGLGRVLARVLEGAERGREG